MIPEKQPRGLRNTAVYLLRSLRFYDLKNEFMTRVIFLVILFGSLSNAVLQLNEGIDDRIKYVLYVALVLVVNLAASVYTFAYIKQLRGENYSHIECMLAVLSKTFTISVAYIVYFAAILSAGLFLIVPGIIVYLMFIFYNCYIMDKDAGIFESFKLSKDLIYGYKYRIFGIMLLISLILMPFELFVLSLSMEYGNSLIFEFVFYFLSTIATLITQRLIAQLYVDLQSIKNMDFSNNIHEVENKNEYDGKFYNNFDNNGFGYNNRESEKYNKSNEYDNYNGNENIENNKTSGNVANDESIINDKSIANSESIENNLNSAGNENIENNSNVSNNENIANNENVEDDRDV